MVVELVHFVFPVVVVFVSNFRCQCVNEKFGYIGTSALSVTRHQTDLFFYWKSSQERHFVSRQQSKDNWDIITGINWSLEMSSKRNGAKSGTSAVVANSSPLVSNRKLSIDF